MLLKMKVWNIFNMTKTPYESGEFLTGWLVSMESFQDLRLLRVLIVE